MASNLGSKVITLRSQSADLTIRENSALFFLRNPLAVSQRSKLLVSTRLVNLYHGTPSVKQTLSLQTLSATYSIPGGINWSAQTIANYLNTKLVDENVSVEWDRMQYKFVFRPYISIAAAGTSSQTYDLLGFVNTGQDLLAKEISDVMVNIGGPRQVQVLSNLLLYRNEPDSNVLCTVPINCNFGELIYYADFGSALQCLCLNESFSYILITLVDENGDDLVIPSSTSWDVTLVFNEVPENNVQLQTILNRG